MYSDRMQTRRFWKNKEGEITGEESVPLSGSSNHRSVCPHLPVGALSLSLLSQVSDKPCPFVLSPPPPRPCLPAAVIAHT